MKRNKIFIAVTGGIGSGKSAAVAAIAAAGYPTFSADAFARTIYEDREVLRAVKARFPDCVAGDKVDRKKLAEIVFHDGQALAALNAFTHPAIMRRMFSAMERADGRLIFAEVPLLFEGGYERDFDEVIVILRERESRIAAVVKRDGIGAEEAEARLKNQFDYEKNLPSGHTVIYNDGDLCSLNRQVADAVAAFKQKYCN